MGSKEMLYELSLKFNTLKMYENTLEQMKKNGVSSDDSIKKIEDEKNIVEKELFELLNPKTEGKASGIKDPSLNENEFIKTQKNKCEYKSIYSGSNSFFDEISKKEAIKPLNKPTYAEIQDKISNSQWISKSNFIVEFPKNEVNIDEWRVSGFYYQTKQTISCSHRKCSVCSGELFISVNDFADKNDDGTYNILAKIIVDLDNKSKTHVIGDICVKIISNGGEELYEMCFLNCRYINSYSDGFTYEATGLRKVNLHFEYDELCILAPNEDLRKDLCFK